MVAMDLILDAYVENEDLVGISPLITNVSSGSDLAMRYFESGNCRKENGEIDFTQTILCKRHLNFNSYNIQWPFSNRLIFLILDKRPPSIPKIGYQTEPIKLKITLSDNKSNEIMQELNLSLKIEDLWKKHWEQDEKELYIFWYFAANTLSFFLSFFFFVIVICRYIKKGMSVRKSFKEVMSIMKSGDPYINLYKKHDLDGGRKRQKIKDEEKKSLLDAHQEEQDDEGSEVSYYYEDENGHVKKKMVKRKHLDKERPEHSDLDENEPMIIQEHSFVKKGKRS